MTSPTHEKRMVSFDPMTSNRGKPAPVEMSQAQIEQIVAAINKTNENRNKEANKNVRISTNWWKDARVGGGVGIKNGSWQTSQTWNMNEEESSVHTTNQSHYQQMIEMQLKLIGQGTAEVA